MFGNNFAGNYNNNSNQKSINTRIRTFYSDLSALQLSYWNENISVKINPFIGLRQDGIRQYDFNRKIMTAISTDKAIALYKKLKKNVIPEIEAIENGEKTALEKDINVGVPIGQGTLLFIQYKMIENVPTLELVMYTNVVDGKVAPENIFKYRFNKTEVAGELNEETMEMEMTFVETEFQFFYDKLKNISTIIADAAHSVNVSNAYSGGNNNYASGNNYGGNNYGNNNGNYGGNNYQNNSNNSSNSAQVSDFNAEDFPFN